MAFVVKTAKTVRTHWKKSTFGAVCFYYGACYTKNYIETQNLMRVYCEKAARYGREPIPINVNPRSITVVLNPNANKRGASDDFNKYCAPLLHLAGILVEVVKTESEGHARELMDGIINTDAIVVAGGDGTLSEVVTGLLRRTQENTNELVPIGVLPLGKTNSVAKSLFPVGAKAENIRCIVDATIAVIEEVVKPVDVMKIEVFEKETGNIVGKPVYALNSIKWGAFRDAEVKKENYWYFGKLQKYTTYLFNGYKNSLSWNCAAQVNYSIPCEGCSNCVQIHEDKNSKKWYQKLKKEVHPKAKYLSINNPACQEVHEKQIATSDFSLLTSNSIPSSISQKPGIPKLEIKIGPENPEYIDFVRQGWLYEKGETKEVKEVIEAKTIQINPEVVSKEEKEYWFSIDNENYEVKPIKITLLPKVINMFCTKEAV
ncbi:unnamed protein product [Brassicogethes aeneus]|uniref:Acylglycerol kinase, mitochondrial n=1 Tax=Brassicogethes aeneus TaxID=1431903 RepID=A0A9P0BFA0_BRAAE|nr:unnamed protein product [Brassicogethes aeneus]